MKRRSYHKLMKQPAFYLLDEEGAVTASVSAGSFEEARSILKRSGLKGKRIRRMEKK